MAKRTLTANGLSREEIAAQALSNAKAERSFANYPAIVKGFIEMGIDADDIIPRENIFTYNAWLALGRQVRKGSHGVKIVTWIPAKGGAAEGAEQQVPNSEGATEGGYKFARGVTVFHISQTDPIQVKEVETA